MKRELTYRGLTLRQMTWQDLWAQLEMNVQRLRARTGILAVFGAIAALTVHPAAGAFCLGVAALTGYWLMQNNRAIRAEIASRQA